MKTQMYEMCSQCPARSSVLHKERPDAEIPVGNTVMNLLNDTEVSLTQASKNLTFYIKGWFSSNISKPVQSSSQSDLNKPPSSSVRISPIAMVLIQTMSFTRDRGIETQCMLKVPAWAYETYENLPILTLRWR